MSLFEELIEDRQEDEKIVKSFKTKDSLSPDIFKRDGESFVMLGDVRKKLLHVSSDFLDSLGVEFFVHDIILTGSLANFNWSDYSDVDIHILLDMDEFGEENKNEILLRKIFKEFFDTKKDYWNHKHDIKIKNFDVEVYVQDLKDSHISSGVYSLVQDKWLIEPEKNNPSIDDNKIINKGEEVQKKIDDLFNNVDDKNIIEQIDELREKIKKFRKCGLDNGGEYSYENLVFKLLRRNGYIEKLLKLKRCVQDKKMSLNENPDEVNINGNVQVKFSNRDGIPFGIYDDILMLGYNKDLLPTMIYDKIKKNYIDTNIRILDKAAWFIFDDFTYSIHPEIPIFYYVLHELGIEKKFVDFGLYKKDYWRSMFKFAGRFWTSSKIISFWEFPETSQELLDVLKMVRIKTKKIYGFDVDFNDYQIEIKTNDSEGRSGTILIPISEYVGDYIGYSDDELSSPHTLSPEEKSKHPQMVAAKQSNMEYLGKKEKGWDSMSKRNFILNKNVAENKK